MYSILIALHSVMRWLVLLLLIYTILSAFQGLLTKRSFRKSDDALRHWTATLAHIQLMIGILLYTKSPIVKYFWSDGKTAVKNFDFTFFGLIHIGLMLVAIVLLTIGSALAKRQPTDQDKFRTICIWFAIALLVILIAVPWPFSPLASRPYIRPF